MILCRNTKQGLKVEIDYKQKIIMYKKNLMILKIKLKGQKKNWRVKKSYINSLMKNITNAKN